MITTHSYTFNQTHATELVHVAKWHMWATKQNHVHAVQYLFGQPNTGIYMVLAWLKNYLSVLTHCSGATNQAVGLSQKILQKFLIPHHIESLDVCMEY
jgi:hypothetical protein